MRQRVVPNVMWVAAFLSLIGATGLAFAAAASAGDPCPAKLDIDGDGVCDDVDNCPDHANANQADCDEDTVGDVCEIANGTSADCNNDGIPDACEIEQLGKLTASDAAANDEFGLFVSMDGDVAVVGSSGDACAAGSKCGAAYVYRFDGTKWNEEVKLTASDAARNDEFGTSVAVSGATIAVGSKLAACDAGSACGAIYVYRFDGSNWIEEDKLIASDAVASDVLGFSVAINGDTIVAGAVGFDCPAGNSCGAAYVFGFDGAQWVEESKLVASDGAPFDQYGITVAVHGDKAVVGARFDDCAGGNDCGAAYAYRFDGAQWTDETKLAAPIRNTGDEFGWRVAAGANTIVVGAPSDDCAAGSSCGAAYVYRFNGLSWNLQAELRATDAEDGDLFGRSISVTTDVPERVVVGSSQDDCTPSVINCGSAYVFRFDGTQWIEESKLTASDGVALDGFGESVSISGERALVGSAVVDCPAGLSCGTAYMFDVGSTDCNGNGVLDECDVVAGNGGDCTGNGIFDACEGPVCDDANLCTDDECVFGACINAVTEDGTSCTDHDESNGVETCVESVCTNGLDCDGNGIIDSFDVQTGLHDDCDDNSMPDACELRAPVKLTASGVAEDDEFGASVSISGYTAIVGAPNHRVGNYYERGAAFVFRFDGTQWTETAELTTSDVERDNEFGESVSLSGDTAVVGARRRDCAAGSDCGAAYVYQFDGVKWLETAKLTAFDAAKNDFFGSSVSVYGDTILVGAASDDCAGVNVFSCGAVYVFRFDGSSWLESAKLTALDAEPFDYFGGSVSLSGNMAVIGAAGKNCTVLNCGAGTCTMADCGRVYVFRFNGAVWYQSAKLSASDRASEAWFGHSVSASGDTVVVGAQGAGSTYAFRFDGARWIEAPKLDRDRWGVRPVSVSGEIAVAGHWSDGAAYAFRLDGGRWVETAEMRAVDAGSDDRWFGQSVSVSGNSAVIGANNSAFVFGVGGSDCNHNDIPDACDLTDGTSVDCNSNDIPDVCDVAAGTSRDCNNNEVLDECDLATATSDDCNANGVPDECDSNRFAVLNASDAEYWDRLGGSTSIDGDWVVLGATDVDCAAGGNCGAAYVYRVGGRRVVETAKLTASDAAAGDLFGRSVSVSGDTAVVGADRDNCTAGGDCGAAYVFRFDGAQWIETAKLTASDAAESARFGFSVSLSGDTVVVGAPGDACKASPGCGAAYVFQFDGVQWVETHKLTAADSEAYAQFGNSVSLKGNTIAVGAPGVPLSAYVFHFDGANWVEEAKLTTADDVVANSVSVDGDQIVVGAVDSGCREGTRCGAVFVYEFDPNKSEWFETVKLTGLDAGVGDQIGTSVSLNNDRIVAGARGGNAAYVFRNNGGRWTEESRLSAPGTADQVAVSGGIAVVGVSNANCPGGSGCGLAYVFALGGAECNGNGVLDECDALSGTSRDCNNNDLPDECELFENDCNVDNTPDDCEFGQLAKLIGQIGAFGGSLSISGDVAIVGAPRTPCADGFDCGTAYVYRRMGTRWVETATLAASDVADDYWFGTSVSLSGDFAVVGAINADCAAGVRCGAVYVYWFDGVQWIPTGKLTASDAVPGDHLGGSVSLSGNTLVAGAPYDDCSGDFFEYCGAAYVFHFNGSQWIETAKLTAPDAYVGDKFGTAVSVSGNTIVVGMPYDLCADGVDCGAAYIFQSDPGESSWVQKAKVTVEDAQRNDRFGDSVATNGDTVFIGAALRDCVDGGINCGLVDVYRFEPTSSEWVRRGELSVSTVEAGDYFGRSISVAGETAVIGARTDCPGNSYCGAAYVYRFNGAQWVESAKISAPEGENSFGYRVSTDGPTALVAGSGDCTGSSQSCGAAYVLAVSSTDCNGNNTLDECELGAATSPDCNANNTLDECESLAGGDLDGNRQIELFDWTEFVSCAAGPGANPSPGFSECEQTCLDAFDFDLDGDVDMQDAAAFGAAFGGPAQP